jgi:phage shock protein C
MTVYASTEGRHFVRNADRAILGGVCAGIADYFGFNLRATRVIFIIAFIVATPFAAVAYIAIVLLVPAESGQYEYVVEREVRKRRRRLTRKERIQVENEERAQAAEAVKQRYQALDERLARIEKYVTSSRYNLDREFRNL